MKKSLTLKSLLVSMAITTSAAVTLMPVTAQAEFSANIAAASNYMWRGVTQTNNNAAVQGGIDFSSKSGVYVGTWGSTLGGSAGYEQDVYFGYAGTAASIDFDLGYIYYAYPVQDKVDFSEVYGSVSKSGFTAGLNYSVSEAADNADTGDIYMFGSYSMDLSDKTSFAITAGNQSFAEKGSDSYSHIQASFSAGDFTFAYDKLMDDKVNDTNEDKLILSITYSQDLSF